MLERLAWKYPVRMLLLSTIGLLTVVWFMPGEPRPATVIGLTASASTGPCHE